MSFFTDILERARFIVSQVDNSLGSITSVIQGQPYTRDFYKHQRRGSRRTAREIIPLVLELVQPRDVIDIGCGVGTWLSVFKEYGVEDIWGVDGEYVVRSMLEIPEERFIPFDLTRPFRIDRQFDLVISLEVAEHLPAEFAETFINSLTSLGPVIVFSAAAPFQGGTHHINEQWPDYWSRFFAERDYVVIDCIRKRIWQNGNVIWFYAQNTLMFSKRDYLESHPILKEEAERTGMSQLSVAHPKALSNMSLRSLLRLTPIVAKKTLKRNVERRFAVIDDA